VDCLNNITARRRIVVLGAMQELGKSGDKIYRRIAQKIYTDKVDLVLLGKGEIEVVTDELLKQGFIEGRLQSNLTNPQIVAELLQVLGKGDVVLLKSAPETRFDEVVSKIAKK
jgi:UDP-N-acetylmuramyl pentapeptide synthase